MIKNLKLGTKLNLLLSVIFILIVVLSGLSLSAILNNYAEQVVTDRALILIETMGAVRDYTSSKIRPELAYKLETEEQFVSETVPAYSAREVFEGLRQQEEYSDFFYKEATINPTNLRDKADSFESQVIERFRQQPELKEQEGFRNLPSGKLFYVARPLAVSQESCLQCHSIPAVAPKSQLVTYGKENGFGWQLNEIVGTQIVSVPASEVINTANKLKFLVMGILSIFLLVAVVLINLFLNFSVVRHLKQMAHFAKQVSTGNMEAEFNHQSKDEIGVLAASMNRLKTSLQMAMDMLNAESN